MTTDSTAAGVDIEWFDEAKEIVRQAIVAIGTEWIPLSDALGRVSASDIVAEEDLVPYARSAMDGYAVRSSDTISASPLSPIRIPVAGTAFTREGQSVLPAGTAMGITTGAPIPSNADAVVPHERVELRNGTLILRQAIPSRDCIFPSGEDVRSGETLVERGTVLSATILGLLAFVGKSNLHVYRPPRVHVLCTGSELVSPWETPTVGQVRNSNAYTLMALLSECGAKARYGTISDNVESLSTSLRAAREDADMLITTGGASVGERDLVKSMLEQMGLEFEFRRVAMRPGKPVAFGMWETLPVCVLPGNPTAAFVCFQQIVRPALLKMAGRTITEEPMVKAQLVGTTKSKAGSRYIVLAHVSVSDSKFLVRPLENQCSALVRNPAAANALIHLAEGPAVYESGDHVDVQVLDWESALKRNGAISAS
jgi:molybdopterin molybdotransferase